jgi:hypothetical protein
MSDLQGGRERGGARLVLVWRLADDAHVAEAEQTVAFDGVLSSDEMHAYVALRMLGQRGPGTTSLTRHLVTEFAGGDPMLAEELMCLSIQEVLRLPASIDRLTQSYSMQQPAASGTLADWHRCRAHGEDAVIAAKRLDSKYWRACVRSLLPWLEERRSLLIEKLRPALEDYLYPTKGIWRKQMPWGGKVIDIQIQDLEFNDIVAMANYDADPFSPSDPVEQALVRTCRHAKRVRDALAHLRPPLVSEVEAMVREMDQVFGIGSSPDSAP